MAKDLRGFLIEYEKAFPGQVVRVDKKISTKYEITAFMKAFQRQNKFPIVIFNNVTTENGKLSKLPVITNLMASRERIAWLIGTRMKEASFYMADRINTGKQKPIKIDKKDSPVKEVKFRVPQDISLFDLPFVRHHILDGGAFGTSTMVMCYEPDTGNDNFACHRMNIWEDNLSGINMAPAAHLGSIFRKYETMDRDMPCCIWSGHHPAGMIGAQTKMNIGDSHYEAMGAMLGEPVRVTESELYGSDFLVPADAEVVIEGVIPAHRRHPEGPFGEYHEYIGPQRWSPYFIAKLVTMRSDALWNDIAPGTPDHQLAAVFGFEQHIYNAVKKMVPGIKNVYMPVSGCCRLHVYIQIQKDRSTDGREAIMAALSAEPRIKHVFVFDEDIDIFDEKRVLWAIATRTQWDKDLIVIKRLSGVVLEAETAKGGLDATMPLPSERSFPVTLLVPTDVEEKINEGTINQWLPQDVLDKVPYAKPGEV
jgi:2,5-furandicarboxylate decarboxylase 1